MTGCEYDSDPATLHPAYQAELTGSGRKVRTVAVAGEAQQLM
jgi:hypothetical protein